MDLISTVQALDARLAQAGRVAFVPTMGNLHEGHLDMVRRAREQGDTVVASVFVNPLQFGPNEDFLNYPRTLSEDCAKLEAAGCDVVFAPTVNEMYPTQQQVEVLPPPVADELCGAFRPGHFRGVLTVVAKLFNMVQPAVALFGNKDYQQLFVIRCMVRELNFPIRIVGVETVRAEDGLALSSRNGYLSESERVEATRLYRVLNEMAQSLRAGVQDWSGIEAKARAELESNRWRVDYVSVRDPQTLMPPSGPLERYVVLGAAWLGKTRLIDNIEISIGAAETV